LFDRVRLTTLVFSLPTLPYITVLGATAASQKTRATTRATTTASPSSKIHVSPNRAVPRFHRAFRARKSSPVHQQARQTRVSRSSMLKNVTQHLHQNCLCTLTNSYRHLANSYTLLLNDSNTYTVCWPGVESSYTSICLSFGNSLYVILQRWLNTNRYARIYQSTAHFKCV